MDEALITPDEKTRELCPNLTSTKDLIDRIGALSVDVLNKEKVLLELWQNIDELTVSVNSLTEETKSLNNLKDSNENTLKSQGDSIQRLEEEKQSIEKTLRGDIEDVNRVRNEQLSAKDTVIHDLEKTLKGIEAEAIINQEEVRKELMESRNELSILKESIKPEKAIKKKKTSAKPARA